MIHHSTPIHFIDINEGLDYYNDAEFLFIHYAHKMSIIDGIETIKFTPDDNVKVTDWNGWTQLEKIEKSNISEWYELIPLISDSEPVNHQSIQVSSDTIIPVYNSDALIRGFHGEVKFAYNLKYANQIIDTDKIRFKKLFDSNGIDHQFAQVDPVHIDISDIGYKLYTKSKFFNAGVYHMYSSDIISQNIVYK